MTSLENGKSALHYAVEEGSCELVKALLKLGVAVNTRDRNNETPLHAAVLRDDYALCKFLLKQGAETHHQSQSKHQFTPLHLAIHNKKDKRIKKLLIRKSTVNQGFFSQTSALDLQTTLGNTPLHIALYTQQYDIAIQLLQAGAKGNIKNKEGFTPSDVLYQAIQAGANDIPQLLVNALASQPQADNTQWCVMM